MLGGGSNRGLGRRENGVLGPVGPWTPLQGTGRSEYNEKHVKDFENRGDCSDMILT